LPALIGLLSRVGLSPSIWPAVNDDDDDDDDDGDELS
jgi:hypothetical protein